MRGFARLFTLSRLLPFAVLPLLGASGELGAAVLEARGVEGDLTVVSVPSRETYLIAADGSRVVLPLPTTALVHSFSAAGAEWYAAAVDATAAGRRLVVLKGAGAKVKELTAPAVTAGEELREPALLVDAGGLRGLAWIEGRAPRAQVVRAATLTAGGWRLPVTVSPRGPGSQMALATTLLGDGTWLLAWTAFDGRDTEVLWSRWSGASASEPRRLGADNEVPDLTPQLRAVPGGALAAWSRYDGNDYRLHLARFDGTAWSEPEAVGPAGSVYPTLHAGPEGPLLIYLKAAPRGWVVAELDGDDRIRREAGVETLEGERPLLAAADSDQVALKWIGSGGEPEVVSELAWQAVKPRSAPE